MGDGGRGAGIRWETLYSEHGSALYALNLDKIEAGLRSEAAADILSRLDVYTVEVFEQCVAREYVR